MLESRVSFSQEEVYLRFARNATIITHLLAHFSDIVARMLQDLTKERSGERKKNERRCCAKLYEKTDSLEALGSVASFLRNRKFYLINDTDKEHVDRVTCCPGLGMGYFGISRKIIGVRVKTDNGNECCEKHEEDTYNADRPDDRFSHTSSLIGYAQNFLLDICLPNGEALPPKQLQLLFHLFAVHLRVADRRVNGWHPGSVRLVRSS